MNDGTRAHGYTPQPAAVPQTITVPIPGATSVLAGDLTVPGNATGLVIFAHGSGSSRLSPRNRLVAQVLQSYGLATLLFDLLTPAEEMADAETACLRFDIPLLAARLAAVTAWVATQPRLRGLPIGYFGASTGAAAALVTAADTPTAVAAVVSRGGRPDLAADRLQAVRAPTLLIVGECDPVVIGLNIEARRKLGAHSAMKVVPHATHLFPEPGTLEEVARLTAEWFARYLRPAPSA
ncbi:MAG: dienelactone hydrolase family protein [Gemmatimonadaceae bacterium]|nr:dienelactone hydrolase family protein [Gemmatimonadaceae bacterium]